MKKKFPVVHRLKRRSFFTQKDFSNITSSYKIFRDSEHGQFSDWTQPDLSLVTIKATTISASVFRLEVSRLLNGSPWREKVGQISADSPFRWRLSLLRTRSALILTNSCVQRSRMTEKGKCLLKKFLTYNKQNSNFFGIDICRANSNISFQHLERRLIKRNFARNEADLPSRISLGILFPSVRRLGKHVRKITCFKKKVEKYHHHHHQRGKPSKFAVKK